MERKLLVIAIVIIFILLVLSITGAWCKTYFDNIKKKVEKK